MVAAMEPPARPRAQLVMTLLITGLVLVFGSLPLALSALGWAAFWSVGTRGSTTGGMIRYNLGDPLLALFAYGPLVLTALLALLGVALLVTAAVVRQRARRQPPAGSAS